MIGSSLVTTIQPGLMKQLWVYRERRLRPLCSKKGRLPLRDHLRAWVVLAEHALNIGQALREERRRLSWFTFGGQREAQGAPRVSGWRYERRVVGQRMAENWLGLPRTPQRN